MTERIQWRVAEIFEVDLPRGDESFLTVRVEVFRADGSAGLYRLRMWTPDFARIQPTLPQKDGVLSAHPADQEILVELTDVFGYDRGEFACASVEEAREFALRQLDPLAERLGAIRGS